MLATVADTSQVAEIRRSAVGRAQANGFRAEDQPRVALVATEMATNLLKHAGRGEIMIDAYADRDGSGLELVALDKGPGIDDVPRALADGYSTGGSPGNGLGAIRRQADQFAIWSSAGKGTAVMARFRNGAQRGTVELGAITRPFPGESVSGDAWRFGAAAAGPTLMMVDGSGHGPRAAEAAKIAEQAFDANIESQSTQLMTAIHKALAPTRGAAVAVARIDRQAMLVRFIGIGNIGAMVASGGSSKRMVSHNGTAGHVAPNIREFTYPWNGSATVILHSDGLSARWELADYPGLGTSHPSLIAGVLFRDFRRDKDDASVAVMRVLP